MPTLFSDRDVDEEVLDDDVEERQIIIDNDEDRYGDISGEAVTAKIATTAKCWHMKARWLYP